MAAIVRYSTGATLTYHLTTYSPWEGYRTVQRLWQRAEQDPFDPSTARTPARTPSYWRTSSGGAGGADPLGRASTHPDGVFAILPGVGANISFASGLPVDLTRLVQL